MKPFLLLITLFISPFTTVMSKTKVMKHELQIREVSGCEAQGTRDIVWSLRLKRVSRDLVVMEGNITMSVDLDSSVGATINVQERGNGGWIDSSFVFNFKDMCKDFGQQYMEPAWTLMWTKAGLHPPIECPVAKGNYFLQDYPVKKSENTKFLSEQQQFTDDEILYKAIMNFVRNSDKEIIGCVIFVFTL